ncbi:MAG: PKD domain-containing protein [Chlorobi bacterium]|nr:PKD domain-containing protein [Chlorobiota bacterium]
MPMVHTAEQQDKQFHSAGSTDSDGTISSYSWNFGDGGTSSSANPTHAYATAGSYTATLTVTDNGGLTGTDQATVTITAVSSGNYATLPYSTGFESGLDQNWSTQGSNSYSRIQLTTANTPHSGSYHLTMDVTTNGNYCTNEAWMGLNLTGTTQVNMSFWWKDFSDETHSSDGVYFSDNGGTSFVKVFDLNGGSYTNNSWSEFTLDVDQLAASNGLSLSGTFVVKFQQYDNYSIATDGMAFDDISVSEGSTGGGTTDPPTGYCASQGNNSSYEWIDLVQLGSINNSTGNDGGYADYTSQSTNIVTGTQYTIYFSTGFSSSSYTEYWKVFIDYNRDGDFNDTGEEIVTGSSSSSGTLSSSFTVPSGASLGYTRMRVSMKYNSAPTACETFTYGEVEDYLVNIGNTAFGVLANSDIPGQKLGFELNDSYKVYPNPATSIANIIVPKGVNNVSIDVLDITGSLVHHIDNSNGRIDVSNYLPGLYSLIINDGNKIEIRKLIIK